MPPLKELESLGRAHSYQNMIGHSSNWSFLFDELASLKVQRPVEVGLGSNAYAREAPD